jgi:hypothetical protein
MNPHLRIDGSSWGGHSANVERRLFQCGAVGDVAASGTVFRVRRLATVERHKHLDCFLVNAPPINSYILGWPSEGFKYG